MKKPKLKTVLICLALFFLFLVIRFPFSNLKGYLFGKVNKDTGITIMAEDLYLTFLGWPGVAMKNVEVIVPQQVMGTEIDISAQKMTARAGFGLFPPALKYSAAIDGLKKGGDLYVQLVGAKFGPQGFSSGNLNYDTDGLDLSQIPLGGVFYGGKATGVGSIFVDSNDLSKTSGSLQLDVNKFVFPAADFGGFTIPQIKLGDLKAKLIAKGGVIELQTFTFGGSDADISGQFGGEIKLGQNIFQSSINITMKINFSDAFAASSDTANQTFITILNNYDKRSPGKSYNLRWNKTIMQIVQNFFENPPEAIP